MIPCSNGALTNAEKKLTLIAIITLAIHLRCGQVQRPCLISEQTLFKHQCLICAEKLFCEAYEMKNETQALPIGISILSMNLSKKTHNFANVSPFFPIANESTFEI